MLNFNDETKQKWKKMYKKEKPKKEEDKLQTPRVRSDSALKSANHQTATARSILVVKSSYFTKIRQKSGLNALH